MPRHVILCVCVYSIYHSTWYAQYIVVGAMAMAGARLLLSRTHVRTLQLLLLLRLIEYMGMMGRPFVYSLKWL